MLMGFFHVPNLVMTFTVCHGFSMALIEIDALPFLKMGGSFHGWRTVNVITSQDLQPRDHGNGSPSSELAFSCRTEVAELTMVYGRYNMI